MSGPRKSEAWSGMGTGWAITSTLVGGMATRRRAGIPARPAPRHGNRVHGARHRPRGGERDLHRVSAVRQGRRVTTTVEPERELVRRLLPFSVPALAIAAGAGAAIGGSGAAWSAAIAIVVVALNFVAHAGVDGLGRPHLADGPDGRRTGRLRRAPRGLHGRPPAAGQARLVLPARVRRRVRAGHDRAPRGGDAAARRGGCRPTSGTSRSGPRDRGDPRRGVPPTGDQGLRLRLLLQRRPVRHRDLLQLHHRARRGVGPDLHALVLLRVPEAEDRAGQAPVADGAGSRVRARADRAADARAGRRPVPAAAGHVLLLHLLHEHVRGRPVGELLGEQPPGVPARPRRDRLGHVQRRGDQRNTGSSAT